MRIEEIRYDLIKSLLKAGETLEDAIEQAKKIIIFVETGSS